jgi:hypothetical protein
MADAVVESEAQVYEKLKAAGERLKPGLWRGDDLEALKAIAHDIVGLEAKAQAALKGRPGWIPPIHPLPRDPVQPLPRDPVQPLPHDPVKPLPHDPVKPVFIDPVKIGAIVHPTTPVTATPVTATPVTATPVTATPIKNIPIRNINIHRAQPLTEAVPEHAELINKVAPSIQVDHLFVFPPIPPDPARAAMYRAAAARAVDSAASLALIRIQADANDVDSLRGRFVKDVWSELGALLPSLSSTSLAPPQQPEGLQPAPTLPTS